jgi:hypothetical protein
LEKAESFSGSDEKEVFEHSGEVDGERKGCRKKKLEECINFYFSFYLLYSLADDKRTDRYQDEPVTQNDPKGEFIAVK